MGQIFIIEATPTQKLTDQMLLMVSKERQQRMQSTWTSSKFAGLLGEALIFCIARQRAKCEIGKMQFIRNEYGKPYIPELPMFYFNISHSNHFLAIALSNHQVGVDIERIKPVNLRIAKRFFSKEEQTYVFSCPKNQIKRFYEIWTKKEAYVKYIGCGFQKPLADINMCDSNIASHLLTYTTSRYCLSVFRHNNKEDFEIQELSDNVINEIINMR